MIRLGEFLNRVCSCGDEDTDKMLFLYEHEPTGFNERNEWDFSSIELMCTFFQKYKPELVLRSELLEREVTQIYSYIDSVRIVLKNDECICDDCREKLQKEQEQKQEEGSNADENSSHGTVCLRDFLNVFLTNSSTPIFIYNKLPIEFEDGGMDEWDNLLPIELIFTYWQGFCPESVLLPRLLDSEITQIYFCDSAVRVIIDTYEEI